MRLEILKFWFTYKNRVQRGEKLKTAYQSASDSKDELSLTTRLEKNRAVANSIPTAKD